ncbi:MAG: asparagine--tRNA ligase [bacterium]
MKATIRGIAEHVGQVVTLEGWLYNSRITKKVAFLQVRDGTGIIQVIVGAADVSEEIFECARSLTQETSVRVTGTVQADPRSPIGFELRLSALDVIARPAQEFPISPKEHGSDFLLNNRHLWLRSKRPHAILSIRAEVIRAIRDYFDDHGFTLVDAPIFTPNACEGTSTLFEVPYFDQTAYLSQSGQLYMEAAAMAFGKVYCFGPTFRAEKSKTRRHLTEFWMVEPEVAFLDLDGDMDLAEDFLCFIVQRVVERRRTELEILGRDVSVLEKVQKPFPRISHADAVAMIREEGVEIDDRDDFGGEHETVLSKRFDRPILVHRYPAEVKAFYLKKDPEQPDRALCVDVLAPEGYGEIIGGGVREEDLDALLSEINRHQLDPAVFEWYLDLRRYGSVPHAGFGLGVERTVTWLCGLHHLRETIPFPRLINRLGP